MTNMKNIAKGASAALLTATLALGAGAAGADSAATPIQAHATGTIGFTGPTTLAWSGSGIATQMGPVSLVGSVVVTGTTDACPGGLPNINAVTLTAPNGDTLTLTSADVACPISETAVHGTGHWTVTAGTGRFAGVTGSGALDGVANFGTGQFDVSLTGSLVRSRS